jgi:hypothetical protein
MRFRSRSASLLCHACGYETGIDEYLVRVERAHDAFRVEPVVVKVSRAVNRVTA